MRPLRKSEKQWLFPTSALHQTLSQEQGMTYAQELQKRAYTIGCIRSLAARTHLSIDDEPYDNGGRAKGVLTVAATLVHRFYMRRSASEFPPELMAPTILFIASKIEEEPLKLRYIVNACLEKFENATPDKLWHPVGDHGPLASNEYNRWERDILAAEEITHETLCFDMIIDQPWPIIHRGILGLDALWADAGGPPTFREFAADTKPEVAEAEEAEDGEVTESSQTAILPPIKDRKGKGKVTESAIGTLAWSVLNQTYLFPVSILYHPNIIAFTCFQIAVRLLMPDDDTISVNLREVASRFGLDATADVDDMKFVEECMSQVAEFAEMNLVIKNVPPLQKLWAWIADSPQDIPNTLPDRFLTQAAPTKAPSPQTS